MPTPDLDKTCDYVIWDPASREMRPCGLPASRLDFKDKRVRRYTDGLYGACLCPTHRAFFVDAATPLEVSHGAALRELALLKKGGGKRKSASPKTCPHCGHTL